MLVSCEITLIHYHHHEDKTEQGPPWSSGTEALQGHWIPFSALGSYNKYVAGLHKIKRAKTYLAQLTCVTVACASWMGEILSVLYFP